VKDALLKSDLSNCGRKADIRQQVVYWRKLRHDLSLPPIDASPVINDGQAEMPPGRQRLATENAPMNVRTNCNPKDEAQRTSLQRAHGLSLKIHNGMFDVPIKKLSNLS
jgi:hypothetical protein